MRKEYTFNGEVVEKEPWCWTAFYKDGTTLKQFDDDGNFHQVGEIKQDELLKICMNKKDKEVSIIWSEGMRLVHKYKHYIFDAGTACEVRIKVYQFGYKYNGQHFYSFIFPDDRVAYSINDKLI